MFSECGGVDIEENWDKVLLGLWGAVTCDL